MKRFLLSLRCICILLLTGCAGNEGVTPLMLAAKSGSTHELRQIVSGGAKVDERSRYGWTALMFAAWQGHPESVRILLDAGADPNVVSSSVPAAFETVGDHPPSTALQEAIRNGHLSIAEMLIKGGAKIDPDAVALAGRNGDVGFLSTLVRDGADLNASSGNEFYPTPLCAAAGSGKLQAVTWLIANGADPNQVAVRQTALGEAASKDHPQIVRHLLDHGARPNMVYGSTGETALFSAAIKYTDDANYAKNLSIIRMLLAHGADTNHKAFGGSQTALETLEIQKANALKHRTGNESEAVMARQRAWMAHRDAVIALLRNAR
jgi:ankyrin repeat protein